MNIIRKDQRGMSAVEFALMAPVLFILLFGALDMAHTLYMTSVLQGSLQKAGRDASLEDGTETVRQAEIDNAVRSQILKLANNATVSLVHRNYKSLTQAQQATPEPFTDTNGNGICDAGEPFQDSNNNLVRDLDGADEGQGGAKDVVVYTAKVSYARLFPMFTLIGMPATVNLTATTVLANQPYGEQSQQGAPTVRNCP